jgi:transketolase
MMSEISMRESYGRALAEYGNSNCKVVALDVDTSCSTFSNHFAERFPDRFYNIGIAEPCMVDVAVGLALGGLIPFINGFACLLALRALEQIRTCVCYARTNVKIAASYAGLSDFKDGPTHYSMTDIANLRALPGMTVVVPADAAETAKWVPVIAEYDGPVYFRISRAAALPVSLPNEKLEIGKGIIRCSGNDFSIITTGTMTGRCMKSAEILNAKGLFPRVIELHTIKPLDTELIIKAAEETHAILTVEEHSVIGGLGSAVAETIVEDLPVKMKRLGIKDIFCPTGRDPDSLLDAVGLSIEDIVQAAQGLMEGEK